MTHMKYIVAALYVDPKGPYWDDPRCDCWDEKRDARLYRGPLPVVAHPPCASWCALSGLRESVNGYLKGFDDGCFAAALQALLRFGGVLEHPAYSHAWAEYGLQRPVFGSWQDAKRNGISYKVTEVWQVDYGHLARKKTWLAYVGRVSPSPLRWLKLMPSASVGSTRDHPRRFETRLPPSRSKITPIAFRDELIELAKHSR